MNKQEDELSNWQIRDLNSAFKSIQIINDTLCNTEVNQKDTKKLRGIREKLISHIHFVYLYDFIIDE